MYQCSRCNRHTINNADDMMTTRMTMMMMTKMIVIIFVKQRIVIAGQIIEIPMQNSVAYYVYENVGLVLTSENYAIDGDKSTMSCIKNWTGATTGRDYEKFPPIWYVWLEAHYIVTGLTVTCQRGCIGGNYRLSCFLLLH